MSDSSSSKTNNGNPFYQGSKNSGYEDAILVRPQQLLSIIFPIHLADKYEEPFSAVVDGRCVVFPTLNAGSSYSFLPFNIKRPIKHAWHSAALHFGKNTARLALDEKTCDILVIQGDKAKVVGKKEGNYWQITEGTDRGAHLFLGCKYDYCGNGMGHLQNTYSLRVVSEKPEGKPHAPYREISAFTPSALGLG